MQNSARGVWTVTDHGRRLAEEEMRAEIRQWKSDLRERRRAGTLAGAAAEDDEAEAEERSWKDLLIGRLLELPPAGFERLAQRLLREAGFVNVTVTGKSGDGGIDGAGTYRISLVSFPVYFQCKRYKGVVTPSIVRDFRGAMAGRGEKGLLITTGSFTREAQAEATRDGAPPVELIDGDWLCDLLREYNLGVDVRQRIEEDIIVNLAFFDKYASSPSPVMGEPDRRIGAFEQYAGGIWAARRSSIFVRCAAGVLTGAWRCGGVAADGRVAVSPGRRWWPSPGRWWPRVWPR